MALAAPALSFVLQKNSEAWFGGYQISFELLLINALLTALGLVLIMKKGK